VLCDQILDEVVRRRAIAREVPVVENLAMLLNDLDRPSDAIAALREMRAAKAALRGKGAVAWSYAAWISKDPKELRDAVTILAPVLDAEVDDPEEIPLAMQNLAAVHLALGERDQALAMAERCLALDPRRRKDLLEDPDLAPLRGDPRFPKG